MTDTRITRTVRIPDGVRINRYQRVPELGPSLLFFSGGSALTGISGVLKKYTHNSIHMVTPFDSGGSSAKLRRAFDMPSIGDLRSRLVALADDSIRGQPDIYKLFAYRLPDDLEQEELITLLESMWAGKHPLVSAVQNPMRRLIRNQIGYFYAEMPEDFDLRGASIGNLILAGGYLNNHQHLDPIIFLFSKLVDVLGTVRATINDDLHVGADLEDGRRIIAQHRLTGKEVEPIDSPIARLFLSRSSDEYVPVECEIRKKNRKLIEGAELICFPPGSFYSSLIANLLPNGVCSAIANNGNPKVYIPNLGRDPEQVGMDLNRSLTTLLHYLRGDCADTKNAHLLNFILMDSERGDYGSKLDKSLLRKTGVEVIDTRLVTDSSAPYYDPNLVVAALLSLT